MSKMLITNKSTSFKKNGRFLWAVLNDRVFVARWLDQWCRRCFKRVLNSYRGTSKPTSSWVHRRNKRPLFALQIEHFYGVQVTTFIVFLAAANINAIFKHGQTRFVPVFQHVRTRFPFVLKWIVALDDIGILASAVASSNNVELIIHANRNATASRRYHGR